MQRKYKDICTPSLIVQSPSPNMDTFLIDLFSFRAGAHARSSSQLLRADICIQKILRDYVFFEKFEMR
jgi:hypothetical protein